MIAGAPTVKVGGTGANLNSAAARILSLFTIGYSDSMSYAYRNGKPMCHIDPSCNDANINDFDVDWTNLFGISR